MATRRQQQRTPAKVTPIFVGSLVEAFAVLERAFAGDWSDQDALLADARTEISRRRALHKADRAKGDHV